MVISGDDKHQRTSNKSPTGLARRTARVRSLFSLRMLPIRNDRAPRSRCRGALFRCAEHEEPSCLEHRVWLALDDYHTHHLTGIESALGGVWFTVRAPTQCPTRKYEYIALYSRRLPSTWALVHERPNAISRYLPLSAEHDKPNYPS